MSARWTDAWRSLHVNVDASWSPDIDGRVVKVLSESRRLAALDVTGSGQPANAELLTKLGIDVAEQRRRSPTRVTRAAR